MKTLQGHRLKECKGVKGKKQHNDRIVEKKSGVRVRVVILSDKCRGALWETGRGEESA